MFSQLTADRPGADLAAAPAFDPKRQPQRSLAAAVLNLAQPATAGCTEPEGESSLFECEALFGPEIGEKHASVSPQVKLSSSGSFPKSSNDKRSRVSHPVSMALPTSSDWYLREWFATIGLKQFDLVTRLDYPRGTAHKLWHGIQPYRRDNVVDIAALLNIQPFELLMPPEEAMALRRLRSAIAEVAKAEPAPAEAEEAANPRTGTDG